MSALAANHPRASAVRDGVACLQARGYITLRWLLRRLQGVAGKPWGLLALVFGVSLIAVVQILALRQAPAAQVLDQGLVGLAAELAPLVPALLAFAATFRSPLRLNVADVSWLLTAPGGPRALFGWQVALRPARYALLTGLATLVSQWQLGLPLGGAWKAAAVGAITGLALRCASYGVHLVAVRARARVPLRVLAAGWAVALLAALLAEFPGQSWVQLEPVTQRLLSAALDPRAASTGWLLTVVGAAAVAAALLIVGADGFQESAEDSARQDAQAQETLRRTRSGQEAQARYFRTGLRSLGAGPFFVGERALCYRALAQERRMLRQQAIQLVVGLAITGVLLTVWPRFAWAPAAYLLLGFIVSSPMEGLGVELDHYHLRLAPMRPVRALLWVNAVPVVRTLINLEALWLPLLLTDAIDSRVVTAGAVLLPGGMVLIAAAGGLTATVAEGILARLILPVALVAAGCIPALAIVTPVIAAQAPSLLVPLAVAALVAASIPYVVLTHRRVWGIPARNASPASPIRRRPGQ